MPDGPMKRLNWTRRPRKVVLVAFQRGWRGVTVWARRLQGAVAFAVRLVDRWLNESVRRVFRFLENCLGPITVVVIAVVVTLSIVFWDWLSFGESGSPTIRNVGLVLAALVALPLAVWRSKVAERQASAAQRQADTAQQNLLNERYQRGAEMLGSDVLAVRLGGIYALQRLAQEHPKQYHIQIMRLFYSFVSLLRNSHAATSKRPVLPTYAEEVSLTIVVGRELEFRGQNGPRFRWHGDPQRCAAHLRYVLRRNRSGVNANSYSCDGQLRERWG